MGHSVKQNKCHHQEGTRGGKTKTKISKRWGEGRKNQETEQLHQKQGKGNSNPKHHRITSESESGCAGGSTVGSFGHGVACSCGYARCCGCDFCCDCGSGTLTSRNSDCVDHPLSHGYTRFPPDGQKHKKTLL